MKNIIINKSLRYLLLLSFFSVSLFLFGQEKSFAVKNDTLKAEDVGFFSIPQIDFEIEKINNYLNKTSKEIEELNIQLNADTSYKLLLSKTKMEAEDFKSYDLEDLSKFFLQNSHRIWSGYKVRLVKIQDKSYDLLIGSEKRNKNLEKQEKTWEKTYENSRNHKIPDIQVKKIRDIQKRINQQHNDNYKISLRVINYETKISDRLNFVVSMLETIESLQNKYRSELFKATNVPIWKIVLFDSTQRTLSESLSLAWYDNTKYLVGNYHAYISTVNRFVLLSIILLVLYYLLMRGYFKKFGDVRKSKVGDLKYIVFQSPITSAISVILFFFYIVFDNIPLALSGTIVLILLLMVYIAMRSFLSKYGKVIFKKFFFLFLLNTLEIVIWYFGDFSRVYLLLESAIGIWFVYPYVTTLFSKTIMPNLRFRTSINLLRYPLFVFFVIAFFANIAGFLNLTVFMQKVSIHITIIITLIIGIYYIITSSIQLLADLISRMEHIRFNVYLPLFKKRITQFFQIYMTYFFFNVFLKLFEYKVTFYKALDEFLFDTREIGSIELRLGDIGIFILIILFIIGINTFVKIIFDEENYRKYESIRGLPAAISMTLRIIFVTAGLFFAFSAAGFDMQNLSIILGALGVGIGFGLQNVVNDYISGLILIYERPVQQGDTVEVDNLFGEVVSIGIRSSNVRTFDGAEVIIPNANMTNNKLINWTLSDKHRRLDIKIGVSYGSDPNQVIGILRDVAEQHPQVVNMPPPTVLFDEFGDSSINFRLLCWVLFTDGIQTKSDIGVAVFEAFANAGVEIPFPQVDLHVKNIPNEMSKEEQDLSGETEKNESQKTEEGLKEGFGESEGEERNTEES